MNKKVVSVCLSLLLLFSLVFVLQVSGNSVSSVTETVGVVNCIISFTCSDSTDSIVIYYDTSPGITTGDSSTYTDPSGCNYGNRADRKMLITGLTESTTYYYRIYAVGEGWADSEDSFTTLDRFTTEYKDEFYDTYLVESSSNMNVVQQTGTKHGSKLIDAGASLGYAYVTMIKDGSIYRMLVADYGNGFRLYSSNDGITWSYDGQWSVIGDDYADRHFGGWTNDSENNQWVVSYCIDEKDGFIATSPTPCGTYTSVKVLEADNNPNSQCYLLNGGLDTLGANKWFDIGKFRLATGDTWRYVGYSWGFTDTDWMSDNVRRDNNGGTGTNDYELITSDQCYANGIIIDSGCYVDFNHAYDEGGDNEIEPYLMSSRDGIDFNAIDSSTPLIPLGSAGSWEDGMIFAAWQAGIFHEGNYDYIYYNGWDCDHTCNQHSSVSRIRFRHDGLTAYEPSSASAWFRTDAIKNNFTANFTVNGDFDGSSTLKIAVLDATTSVPYSGFDTTDFTTINTDSLTHSPSWGVNSLDNIPTGDFKLKFTFSGSSGVLYAYEMDSGSGSSGSSNISFQSINGQANDSVLQDQNRTFIWNIVSGATNYSLRVSNYFDFHDEIFLQLDNISLAEWGATYYSEANGNVTFILPDQYNITVYDYHYYQVRAYTT